MGTALLPLQFRKKTPFVFSRLFSSSAALVHRNPADYDAESAVYRRALKVQRPTTVRYQENLRNFVSLIGAIYSPLRACNTEKFGLYTVLKVRAPAPSNRGFEWVTRNPFRHVWRPIFLNCFLKSVCFDWQDNASVLG